MNTQSIIIIWIKTIFIGSILPGLIGILGGIFSIFYIYLICLIVSGLSSLPLLIIMLIVFRKVKDGKKIIYYYLIGSVLTIVAVSYVFSMDWSMESIPLLLISAYYMLVTIILTTTTKS